MLIDVIKIEKKYIAQKKMKRKHTHTQIVSESIKIKD